MSNVYEAAFLAMRADIRDTARGIAIGDAAAGGQRDAPLSGEWADAYGSADIAYWVRVYLASVGAEALSDDDEIAQTVDALCDEFESAYADWFAESDAAGFDR